MARLAQEGAAFRTACQIVKIVSVAILIGLFGLGMVAMSEYVPANIHIPARIGQCDGEGGIDH